MVPTRKPHLSPFDIDAERYDAWFDSPHGRVLFANEVAALRLLWRTSFRPAVEIGVGTGRFAEALGIERGIDPAEMAVRLARARGIKAISASAELLPFEGARFRAAAFITSLSFISNPECALRETARVLRPGGHVLVAEIPRDSIWGKRCERKKRTGDPFFAGSKMMTVAEIVALLRGTGFKPVAFASTLIRSTPDCPLSEAPLSKRVDRAGFVAVLGVV